MSGRRLHVPGFATILAVVASSALNYAYTVLLGRVLDAEGYGAYASFTSLFMILAALPVAFQQAGARRDGRLDRLALAWGALAGALLLLSAAAVGPWLGVPAGWVAAFAVTVPALVLLGAWRGAAQRAGRTRAFGTSLLAEHGVKIALTAPLLAVMDGPAAAVTATLAGVLLALPVVRPRAQDRSGERVRADATLAPLAVAAASQGALLYGDVLLGGAHLGAADAGTYAAAATLARAVFFAGWAVQVAVFPMVARGDGSSPRLLVAAVGGTLLLAGTPAALFAAFPQVFATLAFGPALGTPVAAVLPACALGTLLLTLGGTVLNHLLAGGSAQVVGTSAALYVLGALVVAALVVASPATPAALAAAALLGKGALLAGSLLVLTRPAFRRPLYVLR